MALGFAHENTTAIESHNIRRLVPETVRHLAQDNAIHLV